MKPGNVVILTAAVAMVAGGGGFALGHFTAPKSDSVLSANTSDGSGGLSVNDGQGRGFRRFGGGHFGAVTAVSGNTVTVKDEQGTSHTVTLGSGTTYTNFADRSTAAQSDVKVGVNIMALGATASDGTITAERIIVNAPAPSTAGAGGPGDSGGGNVMVQN
jgi:hypothetical protein